MGSMALDEVPEVPLPPPVHWVSTQGVSDMLGISSETIRAWRRRGVGPSFHRMGRVIRYDRAAVQDWHDRTLVPERPFKRPVRGVR